MLMEQLAVFIFPGAVILLVILFAIKLDKKRWQSMKRRVEIVRVALIGISTITAVYLAAPESEIPESDDVLESSIASIERSLASLIESATTQETRTANIETALALLAKTQVDEISADTSRDKDSAKPSSAENTRTKNLEMKWNKHCAGDRAVAWEVRAKQGWSIDVGTVSVEKTSGDRESEFQEDNYVISEDSVVVRGKLVNSGSCVKFLGKVVSKDARGHLAGTLTFVEKRKLDSS